MPSVKWKRFQAGEGKGRVRFVGNFRADLTDDATSSADPETIGQIAIPAKTLNRNGAALRFTAIGTFAATAGGKVITVKFGSTTLVTTSFTTVNGAKWLIEGYIWRCRVGQQAFTVKTYNSVDGRDDLVVSTTMTENEEVDNDLLVIGDAAAAADVITCRVLTVEFLG